LADSLPYVTGAALRAHCASASRNAVVAALAAAGAGADAVTLDEAVACGAILERTDGSVSVDATFRARLRTQWRALAIDAVRFLNGDAPA
ncbi:MAG TPA: hypothetical protein VG818_11625, partial [Gemmatimonadaceae bacterium]|nr:hypothetical protein [Gemmatimonadaceae bacterium]